MNLILFLLSYWETTSRFTKKIISSFLLSTLQYCNWIMIINYQIIIFAYYSVEDYQLWIMKIISQKETKSFFKIYWVVLAVSHHYIMALIGYSIENYCWKGKLSLFKGNGPKVSCMVSFAMVKEDSHNNPWLWFSNEKKAGWKLTASHSTFKGGFNIFLYWSQELRGNMVKYNKKDFY